MILNLIIFYLNIHEIMCSFICLSRVPNCDSLQLRTRVKGPICPTVAVWYTQLLFCFDGDHQLTSAGRRIERKRHPRTALLSTAATAAPQPGIVSRPGHWQNSEWWLASTQWAPRTACHQTERRRGCGWSPVPTPLLQTARRRPQRRTAPAAACSSASRRASCGTSAGRRP